MVDMIGVYGKTGMVADDHPNDWISLDVLAASAVLRDAVHETIEATGKAAERSGRKLPPLTGANIISGRNTGCLPFHS